MPLSRRAFLSFSFQPTPEDSPPWARAKSAPFDSRDLPRVAEILPGACLAHAGVVCTTCREHCPIPDAIDWVEMKPAINADRCNGCGRCLYSCPAPTPGVRLRFRN